MRHRGVEYTALKYVAISSVPHKPLLAKQRRYHRFGVTPQPNLIKDTTVSYKMNTTCVKCSVGSCALCCSCLLLCLLFSLLGFSFLVVAFDHFIHLPRGQHTNHRVAFLPGQCRQFHCGKGERAHREHMHTHTVQTRSPFSSLAFHLSLR